MSTEWTLRAAIAAFGRSLFERGYTAGSSGNISVRFEGGLLVTPTNSCLGTLDPARILLDGRRTTRLSEKQIAELGEIFGVP